MSEWEIRSKKERFAHSLNFGERPERFALITHQKRGNEQIAHFLTNLTYIKHTKNKILDLFSQKILSELLIPSFIISNLSESITVTHLSCATWGIRSRSLFCLERPEPFAHSCSFVLSNLSKSLTVTVLFTFHYINIVYPVLQIHILIIKKTLALLYLSFIYLN